MPVRRLFLAPARQSLPNVCGVELQNTADVFKAEDPIRATVENPSACLVENPFAPSAGRRMIILQALNGIFQYREHKALLSFDQRFSLALIEKLLSRRRFRLKQGCDAFALGETVLFCSSSITSLFQIHASFLLITGIKIAVYFGVNFNLNAGKPAFVPFLLTLSEPCHESASADSAKDPVVMKQSC